MIVYTVYLPEPRMESDFLTVVSGGGFVLSEVKRGNDAYKLAKAAKQIAKVEEFVGILSGAVVGAVLPCIKVTSQWCSAEASVLATSKP